MSAHARGDANEYAYASRYRDSGCYQHAHTARHFDRAADLNGATHLDFAADINTTTHVAAAADVNDAADIHTSTGCAAARAGSISEGHLDTRAHRHMSMLSQRPALRQRVH
jgi:hypothetical protein